MAKYIKSKTYTILMILIISINFIEISHAGEIISIINPDNMGDANQIRGVMGQIKAISSSEWVTKEVNYQELDKISQSFKCSDKDKIIAISSGVYGIDALRSIEKFNGCKLLKVHVSHQILNDYEKLLLTKTNPEGVDIIALPKHAVTENLRKKVQHSRTKLVETVGVCHNLTKEEVIDEFKKHSFSFPIVKKYLVVILGGDVQMPDGKEWKQYQVNEAEKLSELVLARAQEKNLYIIVLNGPRTGKHNVDGTINEKAHKGEIDHVTQTFITSVRAKTENVKLFDFQIGIPSLYKAALGAAVLKEGSEIWIPGESTSMVSEAVDIIDNVVVYDHSAMNQTHRFHIDSEFSAGRVKKLQPNGLIISPALGNKTNTGDSAAACVARETIKAL